MVLNIFIFEMDKLFQQLKGSSDNEYVEYRVETNIRNNADDGKYNRVIQP